MEQAGAVICGQLPLMMLFKSAFPLDISAK
jgi:hypothetical protein